MDAVIATAALAGCAGVCAAPMIGRYASSARIARRCAQERTLVLSYDDGPGAALTGGVLDRLGAHGAVASFFALGRRAERHAATLDRAVREGHEVGTHSYGHVHAWRSMPWTSAADVRRGFAVLSPWVGRGGLFRPPYGKLTPLTWAVAKAAGARFAWWTLDSGDTWRAPPSVDETVGRVRASGGAVVLLHDFDEERDPDRVRHVLDLTDALLGMARREGLRVAALGSLLGARAPR